MVCVKNYPVCDWMPKSDIFYFFEKLKFQSILICCEKLILTNDLGKYWHVASVLDLDVHCCPMLKSLIIKQTITQLIPRHHSEFYQVEQSNSKTQDKLR